MARSLYLHPIMFLFLFPDNNFCFHILALFTFHYVSILIEKISMCQCAGPIYIPLYFYFNDRLMIAYISDISPHHSFTFHHVSILIWIPENFNYAVNDNTPSSILLYVPLCFHFNRVPSRLFQCFYDLYIPLCLYFNRTGRYTFRLPASFTFHYVSILISALQNLSTGSSLLYIPLCLYFNPEQFCRNRRYKKLYIPLCLYFNDESQHSPGGTEAFTFHYVSILIINAHCRRQNTKCLYIPLCLDFNSNPTNTASLLCLSLHSIMSLF